MPLITDAQLDGLVDTVTKLRIRVAEWLTQTEHSEDEAKRCPPQWVIDAVTKLGKVMLQVAQIDNERSSLALAKMRKGAPNLSDEEYAAGVASMRTELLCAMTSEELAIELDRRSQMES